VSRRDALRRTALGGPLLAACGSNGNGNVSSTGLKTNLPDYVHLSGGVTPDFPSVQGVNGAATDPGYLSYPFNPVKTVKNWKAGGGNAMRDWHQTDVYEKYGAGQ
jgi:putative aldouronate transport system substrate-binding protein